MRLDEIRYDKREIAQQNPEREAMVKWLLQYGIRNHRIEPNGVVHVQGNVRIDASNEIGEMLVLPVQFGKVNGNFEVMAPSLQTLKGSPSEVSGDYWIHAGPDLKSIEHTPPVARIHAFYGGAISSIRGIHKMIKRSKQILISNAEDHYVTEGGIGLLAIPGLEAWTVDFQDPSMTQYLWEQFNKPDRDIHEIQEHMMQGHWGAYAKL